MYAQSANMVVFSHLGVSSLKKNFIVFPALVLGFAALANAQSITPTKVAIIHVQNAILMSTDGKKAAGDLTTTFAPRKAELEKKQQEIAALQDQLKKGSTTMSEEARTKLMRDSDALTTKLNRDTQDAQTDLDEAQGKLMQELGNKMLAIIEKYATQNGFALVLDVSNPQTPVLWAASGIDITNDIVKLYDQANPAGAGSAAKPAAPAARPAAPAPQTKTPPAPVVKKQ
jgi:outer membrane protein